MIANCKDQKDRYVCDEADKTEEDFLWLLPDVAQEHEPPSQPANCRAQTPGSRIPKHQK